MFRTITIIWTLLLSSLVGAQSPIRTIVPGTPVVEGEAFRVQYVITDASITENFSAPDFRQFRLVSGPDIYYGEISGQNQFKQSRNYVFTLEAKKPGRYTIPAARAIINGKLELSDREVIEVISREEAYRRFSKEAEKSEYILRPGENVQEKIRQNLFLKLMVDKKSCYVGEPVLATFKLYSRLESKSDIVKNPGFYGFSVFDMINLADRFVTTETVNGKVFDVHTIRKVQLFPLQSGTFVIDPMELKNKIEFSRSSVYKKTEQEIIEGVLGNDDDPVHDAGTTVVENEMSTQAVTITVKPMPVEVKPASYNGAVGLFTITSSILNDNLAKNEEGFLDIVVSGSGNFIQLSAPVVNWPKGLEGFEPVIRDSLDKNTSPTIGKRVFRFPFISDNPGEYTIPSVELSYFNPDSGRYKTVSSPGRSVHVSSEEKALLLVPVMEKKKTNKGEGYLFIGFAVLVTLLGLIWFWWNAQGKKRRLITVTDTPEIKRPVVSIEALLAPAAMHVHGDDKHFYSSLYKAVWNFFEVQFGLSGSTMNKENLLTRMNAVNIEPAMVEEVQHILQQCEAGRFTNANFDTDKKAFLLQTETVLKKIRDVLL